MIFLGIPEPREREREREREHRSLAADEGESTAIHSCALSSLIKVNFKINLGCGSSFSLTDRSFSLFLWSFFLLLPSKQIWLLSLPFCHPFLPHRSTFSLFPFDQPRPDWTLHVTNLVPYLADFFFLWSLILLLLWWCGWWSFGEFCVGGSGLICGWWWQQSNGSSFFPLPNLDFMWMVVSRACPWWWWLATGFCFHFLKVDFLHPRLNTRNNFPV